MYMYGCIGRALLDLATLDVKRRQQLTESEQKQYGTVRTGRRHGSLCFTVPLRRRLAVGLDKEEEVDLDLLYLVE